MKDNALNWFEIYVSDFERTKSFYEKILNRTLTEGEGGGCRMAFLGTSEGGGVGGALTKMDGCGPGAGGTLVYLNVEGDLDGVIARIHAAGGEVVRERMAIPPHGFIGIFEDPEGNVVGLHSMV